MKQAIYLNSKNLDEVKTILLEEKVFTYIDTIVLDTPKTTLVPTLEIEETDNLAEYLNICGQWVTNPENVLALPCGEITAVVEISDDEKEFLDTVHDKHNLKVTSPLLLPLQSTLDTYIYVEIMDESIALRVYKNGALHLGEMVENSCIEDTVYFILSINESVCIPSIQVIIKNASTELLEAIKVYKKEIITL